MSASNKFAPLSRSLKDLNVPGIRIEVPQDEAEAMGCFEEDALTDLEAIEGNAEIGA